MNKDDIFARPLEVKQDFAFDRATADVFDDMLARSVPLYAEVQRLITDIAERFSPDGAVIYDLGCATGTTLLALSRRLAGKAVQFAGVELSQPMIEKARANLSENGVAHPVRWIEMDLNQPHDFDPRDVCVMNLTLQFVRPLQREALLRRINGSLKLGGCLILVEKVLADNSFFSRVYIDLYHAFKRSNGYSEMEIAQKREALENVLVPYRVSENVELLRRSGFGEVDMFFRWLNFAGFVAVKT
jgi:tRNA (cmo5U34)-methyltransferase